MPVREGKGKVNGCAGPQLQRFKSALISRPALNSASQVAMAFSAAK